jgi:hypothetical protein
MLPKWTALPANLDALLARLENVRSYPVPSNQGQGRCDMGLMQPEAPDPHDWHLWRTGSFLTFYADRPARWQLELRECARCAAIEIREVRKGAFIPSARRARSVFKVRPQPREDEVLGWYHGSNKR